MKIQKEESIVLTFTTTTAAIAFEMEAQAAGVEGRLIPTPREISASCGLAWMSRKSAEEALTNFIEENSVDYAGRYELML